MTPSRLPKTNILLTARQIQSRIPLLARAIKKCMAPYPGWILIGVMNGSYVFLADLGRALHRLGLTPPVGFLGLSSYGARCQSSGRVRLSRALDIDVRKHAVLLVDDILDTGRTLHCARTAIVQAGGHPVFTCVLLDKPSRRKIDIQPDFIAFTIPDRFVAGYGLDWNHRFRSHPDIIVPHRP